MDTVSKPRLITPLLICFILLNLLGSTMAQMNTVGSPLLSTKVMGTSAYGGFLVAVFVVAAIVSRIASGNLADRYSRRIVLVSGTLIYLAGVPDRHRDPIHAVAHSRPHPAGLGIRLGAHGG